MSAIDFLPSDISSSMITKGSQLFNAELQQDKTTIEVEMTHILFLCSGQAIWSNFLACMLLALYSQLYKESS